VIGVYFIRTSLYTLTSKNTKLLAFVFNSTDLGANQAGNLNQ
jgi:hypothetical protein